MQEDRQKEDAPVPAVQPVKSHVPLLVLQKLGFPAKYAPAAEKDQD